MTYPHFTYLVTRQEETIATGALASSRIPTIGHVATGFDHYRIAAFADTDVARFNVCFTDVASCAAVARVVEGPIQGFADIEAAETALSALLFHQNIEIIVPTVKISVNGIVKYARPDEGRRSHLAFDLFNIAVPRDHLCAYDFLYIDNGVIVRTERRDKRFRGVKHGDFRRLNRYLASISADVAPAMALDFKIPGYFSDPILLKRYKSPQTFAHEIYDRVSIPWRQRVASVPGLDLSIRLPPLLAIVLSHSKSRRDIPIAIRELHEKLGPIRHELYEFGYDLRSMTDQIKLEQKATHIQESFAAIVPESREDGNRRTLARVWSLVRPVAKAYGIAVNPASLDPDKLTGALEAAKEAVAGDASLVDRTLSARAFSKLLRTESVTILLKRHFTESELRLLETTFRPA